MDYIKLVAGNLTTLGYRLREASSESGGELRFHRISAYDCLAEKKEERKSSYDAAAASVQDTRVPRVHVYPGTPGRNSYLGTPGTPPGTRVPV
eukprot:419434-Rhodomonas_salina.2